MIPTSNRSKTRWCLGSFLLTASIALGLAVTGSLSAVAVAQYRPPPPPLTSAPCVPTKKDPCTAAPPPSGPPSTAERFPFPGEDPGTLPNAAKPDAAKPSTPPDHPLAEHGLPSSPAPDNPPQSAPTNQPADPESSSSSSSSDAASPPQPETDPSSKDPSQPSPRPTGSSRRPVASTRHHLPKVEDLDRRELTDLEVSNYYFTAGNFQGAYLRAKDAVTLFPDDPEAHFAVAHTAEKLKKEEEATAEYKRYLELDPEGDKAKAVQKALASLHP